jgi:hypothetical protein
MDQYVQKTSKDRIHRLSRHLNDSTLRWLSLHKRGDLIHSSGEKVVKYSIEKNKKSRYLAAR